MHILLFDKQSLFITQCLLGSIFVIYLRKSLVINDVRNEA